MKTDNAVAIKEKFFVVTNEPGFHVQSLPTWADNGDLKEIFDEKFDLNNVKRVEIPEVPGAFQLLNVLTESETEKIIEIAETLGFHEDSPVSLPHSVRHNENFNWVASEIVDHTLWNRSKHLVNEEYKGQTAKGINARFRFYKYGEGDFFKPHTDGAWPGSRVIDNKLIPNAYPGLYSQYTYLILLSDDFEGGSTEFMVSKSDPTKPARIESDMNIVKIRTPKGAILCFPHGTHPLHCLHSSEKITKGVKYIIRTDILFG
ncbi:2OG-Fe(II) oxygenase [Aureivirga sp. CE67]|uniref:2OG-Fe(II) oxygenase n=1 Tax=Aureivirga sp. CE67 TaxID=1788983 RepID=UPI0018CADC83|nr:2OG-Fe(II) oxygenase [Aureivirga sp. CE67]